MVSDFSKLMLNDIEQNIMPYEFKADHYDFLPESIRKSIDPDAQNGINGTFTHIGKI
jgi:hypothetical protein